MRLDHLLSKDIFRNDSQDHDINVLRSVLKVHLIEWKLQTCS